MFLPFWRGRADFCLAVPTTMALTTLNALQALRPIALGLMVGCCSSVLFAQSPTDYPNHPIRFVVSFPAAGSTDIVTRLLAQKLSERLGQPFVVEQKVGAGGFIGNDFVAKSAPDGYNLVLLTGGHPSSVAMSKKLPYDPINGFGMVGTVITYPMVVSVATDSEIKDFESLLQQVKAHPKDLSFSASGVGSLHHLLGEWLNIELGSSMLHVPFKGAGQAMTEVIGGRVDLMIETATFSFGQIKGGKMKGLAVSSDKRSPLMPSLPSVSEYIPGLEFSSWLGVAVAPGTPAAIIDKLNRELRQIIAAPEIKLKFAELGGTASPSSPEEMKNRIQLEIERWQKVVELKGIDKQ